MGGIWQDMPHAIKKFRQLVAGTYIEAGAYGQNSNRGIIWRRGKVGDHLLVKWEGEGNKL